MSWIKAIPKKKDIEEAKFTFKPPSGFVPWGVLFNSPTIDPKTVSLDVAWKAFAHHGVAVISYKTTVLPNEMGRVEMILDLHGKYAKHAPDQDLMLKFQYAMKEMHQK
jgi:hypothetical protein